MTFAVLYVCGATLCREIPLPFAGTLAACNQNLPMIAQIEAATWRNGERLVRFECLEGEPV